MTDGETIFFIVLTIITLFALYNYIETLINERAYDQMLSKVEEIEKEYHQKQLEFISEIERQKAELKAQEQEQIKLYKKEAQALHSEIETRRKELVSREKSFNLLISEKQSGFPWLAGAWADFISLQDAKAIEYLKNKAHPALKAAEIVKVIKEEKSRLVYENRILVYTMKFYESMFPWLSDLKEIEIEELLKPKRNTYEEETLDKAKYWLTEGEYAQLSSSEKYQLALDRYQKSRKSNWEIGRDYERYIGYTYENNGFKVYYKGIIEGYEDLGRDLICTKDGITEIVQCKYWSKNKLIRENTINQLFGTTAKYWLEHNSNKPLSDFLKDIECGIIIPRIVTSTNLSDTALTFADALHVQVNSRFPLSKYPSIKCNISTKDGAKIYHLPFDQQYDKAQINRSGECYVFTIKEAEKLGFRRAFRWSGSEK